MVDIMVELFTSSDFNNQDRFISMLREALAGMENSVVTSGNHHNHASAPRSPHLCAPAQQADPTTLQVMP